MGNIDKLSYSSHKDFRRVFITKERKELLGKGYKNLIWLVMIFLITFLSLGFANGSLKYLKKKMDDPFIKWVNIDVPYSMENQINEINELLGNKKTKDSFDYRSVMGNYEFSFEFSQINTGRGIYFKGRSIEPENPILNSILDEKNKVSGKLFLKKEDIGFIVTKDLLLKLGYKPKVHHIVVHYKVNDVIYNIPFPVIAIVNSLPNKNEFAVTPYLFLKFYHSQNNPFDLSKNEYQSQLIYFVPGVDQEAKDISKKIISYIQNKYGKEAFVNQIIEKNESSLIPGFNIHIIVDTVKITNSYQQINDGILNEINRNKEKICRVYNYNLSGFETIKRPLDQLSVNFNSLDKIRDFQQFVFAKYKLLIDMSLIESKENYNFVTKLTNVILFFLILLCVISVILYITNILIQHLEKIKKNIGTFKAFGLTNRTMKFIYAQMINEFLIFAIIISYSLSLILGKLGFIKLLLLIFQAKLEKGQNYFDLINNQYVLYSILLIFVFSVISIIFRLNTLLDKTPGDLIYNRD
jgi:hypothetical protein